MLSCHAPFIISVRTAIGAARFARATYSTSTTLKPPPGLSSLRSDDQHTLLRDFAHIYIGAAEAQHYNSLVRPGLRFSDLQQLATRRQPHENSRQRSSEMPLIFPERHTAVHLITIVKGIRDVHGLDAVFTELPRLFSGLVGDPPSSLLRALLGPDSYDDKERTLREAEPLTLRTLEACFQAAMWRNVDDLVWEIVKNAHRLRVDVTGEIKAAVEAGYARYLLPVPATLRELLESPDSKLGPTEVFARVQKMRQGMSAEETLLSLAKLQKRLRAPLDAEARDKLVHVILGHDVHHPSVAKSIADTLKVKLDHVIWNRLALNALKKRLSYAASHIVRQAFDQGSFVFNATAGNVMARFLKNSDPPSIENLQVIMQIFENQRKVIDDPQKARHDKPYMGVAPILSALLKHVPLEVRRGWVSEIASFVSQHDILLLQGDPTGSGLLLEAAQKESHAAMVDAAFSQPHLSREHLKQHMGRIFRIQCPNAPTLPIAVFTDVLDRWKARGYPIDGSLFSMYLSAIRELVPPSSTLPTARDRDAVDKRRFFAQRTAAQMYDLLRREYAHIAERPALCITLYQIFGKADAEFERAEMRETIKDMLHGADGAAVGPFLINSSATLEEADGVWDTLVASGRWDGRRCEIAFARLCTYARMQDDFGNTVELARTMFGDEREDEFARKAIAFLMTYRNLTTPELWVVLHAFPEASNDARTRGAIKEIVTQRQRFKQPTTTETPEAFVADLRRMARSREHKATRKMFAAQARL